MSKKTEKKQLAVKIMVIALCAVMVFGTVAGVLAYLIPML